MNLLVVEDEKRVADFIRRGLTAEGWSVTVAPDGETALEFLAQDEYSAIVLDLMLPGISGQDVCQRMRAKRNTTPVLMLTALGEPEDRVAGLRMGADDYLAKPFDFDELIARLAALVRRSSGYPDKEATDPLLQIGELSFDTQSLEVTTGETPVDLTTKEREILKLFMTKPDRVYSRERILSTVWNMAEDPLTNVVDVYVARLRKKLGDSGQRIQTVRGAGYRFSTRDSAA